MTELKEYTELESEMHVTVLRELTKDWHSKSDLRTKLNIFDCSKVLYELLDLLGNDYVMVSRDMHGYINFGKGDCKEYEFEAYKVMTPEEAEQLGDGYIVNKDDLNYNPNKKKTQSYAVPIDEPLPSMSEVFKDYNRYNRFEVSSRDTSSSSSSYSYSGYNNDDNNYSYSSRKEQTYPGRGRFRNDQEELDWHTDSFLNSMLDVEDVIDIGDLY